MKLYELSNEIRAIQHLIEEADGDLTPETEALLDATHAGLASKVESCCSLVREWELEDAAIAAEVERLQKRSAGLRRQSERLREYVRRCLLLADVRRLDAGTFRVSLRAGRARVVVDDEDRLPAAYVVEQATRRADKRAIGEALARGEDVPGAHAETGEPSLQVK